MTNESTNPNSKAEAAASKDAAKQKPKKLDLSKLDLHVEKVEERISPSETNVFDK